MVGKVTVRVEGLKELDAALGELPKATARSVLRRVGIKALKPFDERWRVLAPRDQGNLAESGGIGTKLTRRQASLARKDAKANGKDFVEVYAGANDPSAVQQEFGNENHGPQAFMRPAWDETNRKVLEIVKTDLGGEINKAAKRVAARAARLAAKG